MFISKCSGSWEHSLGQWWVLGLPGSLFRTRISHIHVPWPSLCALVKYDWPTWAPQFPLPSEDTGGSVPLGSTSMCQAAFCQSQYFLQGRSSVGELAELLNKLSPLILTTSHQVEMQHSHFQVKKLSLRDDSPQGQSQTRPHDSLQNQSTHHPQGELLWGLLWGFLSLLPISPCFLPKAVESLASAYKVKYHNWCIRGCQLAAHRVLFVNSNYLLRFF